MHILLHALRPEASADFVSNCREKFSLTRKTFQQRENVFFGTKISEKLDRAVAIDFLQKSSNLEVSLRFFGRFKLKRHFRVS